MKLRLLAAKESLVVFTVILLVAVCAWATGPKTVLIYRFTGSPDGRSPGGQLISDAAGNLYGTTTFGGINDNGIVYELSSPPTKRGKWTETVLYRFKGGTDGLAPTPGLVFDAAGNLYGTTFGGGHCSSYCGVVFRLAPPHIPGRAWTETVLYAFGGPNSGDGGGPTGSLVFDNAGNLYGTTELGGRAVCTNFPGPCGVVFKLSPPKQRGGQWTETVLYSFTGIPDGAFPFGYLTPGQQGTLFGTTTEGGTGACTDGEGTTIGCGTLFKLTAKGKNWTESVLFDFQATDSGAALDLLPGPHGSFYAPAGYDIVKLSPPVKHGSGWMQQVLHQFPGGITGRFPSSAVVPDRDGNLYGAAWANGLESQYGTVYKLSPPTKGKQWTVTTLHKFPGNFDSEQPKGRLLWNESGELFGATAALSDGNGYIFKIVP